MWMGVEGAVGPWTNCSLRSFLRSSFLSCSCSESILPSGLRIYDVVSFLLHLEVSSSLPESESPLVVDNLCAGVTLCSPCVQDRACLCPREVSQWRCEGLTDQCNRFRVRVRALSTTLLMSPLMPVI